MLLFGWLATVQRSSRSRWAVREESISIQFVASVGCCPRKSPFARWSHRRQGVLPRGVHGCEQVFALRLGALLMLTLVGQGVSY